MKDGLKIDIGRRLARIRNHLGLNKKQMAVRLDMAYISYNRVEGGVYYPSAVTLHRLSSRLGVSLDWLFRGKGNMFRGKQAAVTNGTESAISSDTLERDMEEMVHLMRHIPLVRYSMMDHFQRFKLDNHTAIDEELRKI